jgi:cytochrome c-type protein NapB
MADPLAHAPARVLALLAAVVVAVAAIGFATGMSNSSYRAKRPPLRERPPAGDVPPARSYAELQENPWTTPDAAFAWQKSVAIAAAASVPAETTGASIERTLIERAERRAYDGAPPVVPHPIRASGAAECLACHAEGFALGDRHASPIPHDAYASCTQCHVSAIAPFTQVGGNAAAEAPSRWSGIVSPEQGEVAYPGAPPAVPHATMMRERCESCHGPQGHAALRTPHPDRLSCLQCHPATGSRSNRASR